MHSLTFTFVFFSVELVNEQITYLLGKLHVSWSSQKNMYLFCTLYLNLLQLMTGEKNKITVCLSNSCYSEINLLFLSQFCIFLEMDVKAHLQPSNFKCFFSKCVHSPFELWLNAQSSWTDALYWSRFVKSLFAISSVITLKSVLFIVSAYMY